MLLAGDVGGTKTILAIFEQTGIRAPLAQETYISQQYPDLGTMASEFLAQTGLAVERAVFGVAGPVVQGRVTGTNLPWELSESALARTLDIPSVTLINDLVALSYGVLVLEPEDLVTLNEGHCEPGGAIAVIAPGTGLGEGFLTWDGSRYRAHPSEGGHTEFGPTDELQIGLLTYLYKRLGHVSLERVCSGRGLPNIYAYLKERDYALEPPWLTERLAHAPDPTPVIITAALQEDPPCPLCRATMQTFVRILGAEAGNLALRVMATAGVYIAGGIPPRILPFLQGGALLKAFCNKGRLSYVMREIPLYVVLNPETALMGAASYGLAQP